MVHSNPTNRRHRTRTTSSLGAHSGRSHRRRAARIAKPTFQLEIVNPFTKDLVVILLDRADSEENFMLHYLGYVLFWPLIFALTILPGVLIGVRVRTWQSSVILAEILTVALAVILLDPTQAIFGEALLLTHITFLPPLLLSVLIGHFGRPQ